MLTTPLNGRAMTNASHENRITLILAKVPGGSHHPM
jgi:hypothetical protein